MALTVEITGGANIGQGDRITLSATVTDSDGNTPLGTLQYAWTASRGTFVGATNEASAVYHADFTDASAVDVTITCNVTRPANATPTSSGPSLTALSEIGITGILVNMFMTELGAIAQNTNNVLYNETTGTLDAGSDQRLSSDIFVHQLRWDNVNNNFVLNNNESGHIGNFFLGNTNQSLYLIFSDGSYLELTATDFAAGTSRGNIWARWLVSDSAVRTLLNGLSTTSDLVVGVGDAGAIGWNADSGSDTETFTVSVIAPLFIESIDEQTIPVLSEDYVLEIDIRGTPDRAYVDGDMEGFYHEWDATNAKIRVKAIKVTRLITGAIWNVHLVKGTKTLDGQIIYNVVPSAPVISDPGAQTLYKGFQFKLMNKVANVPSVMRGSGLLIGLKYVPAETEEGEAAIQTQGILPVKTKLSESSFMMKQYAENDGGTDELDVPVTIKEATFLAVAGSSVLRIYDLRDSNRQFGDDIQVPTSRSYSVGMSGSLVAVSRHGAAELKVYDFINGGQVGPDIASAASEIEISGQYLVAMGSTYIRVYDTDNENVQVGDTINRPSIGAFYQIAVSGTRIAALIHRVSRGERAGGWIQVYEISSSGLQQVGSDISLGTDGNWREGIAMSGSRVAVLRSDSTARLIRVFDTDKNNAQVGSDISLGTTGTYFDIVMSGSRIVVNNAVNVDTLRVFDIDNSGQQVGSDINTGLNILTSMKMLDSLVVVHDSRRIKIFDIDNSGQQVGSDISFSNATDIAIEGEWG